jgi:mannose/cellobiose epimerase-like protein (N-acyl-D-glucosamine 2-epimerase family)
MLDIKTGEQIEALYRMVEISGGKRIEKFSTTDISRALKFHRWYVKRYQRGLYMEILPKKKVYNTKEKQVEYTF